MTSRGKPNSVRGLVVHLSDAGEKDKLAVLLTEGGRLFVTFRGVRAQNAKLKRFAEPYVFAEFSTVGSTATGAKLFDGFQGLKTDVIRAAAAAMIAEAAEKCAAGGGGFEEEFRLTLVALKTAETAETFPYTAAFWCFLKLLSIEGADFREFPAPAAVKELCIKTERLGAAELDAADATVPEILSGLHFASRVFSAALGVKLKSVQEAIRLVSGVNSAEFR